MKQPFCRSSEDFLSRFRPRFAIDSSDTWDFDATAAVMSLHVIQASRKFKKPCFHNRNEDNQVLVLFLCEIDFIVGCYEKL
jgi:hypothetical protein